MLYPTFFSTPPTNQEAANMDVFAVSPLVECPPLLPVRHLTATGDFADLRLGFWHDWENCSLDAPTWIPTGSTKTVSIEDYCEVYFGIGETRRPQ